MKQVLIFLISDKNGKTYGIAPTKLDARIQIFWFLPKNIEYIIEPIITWDG